MKLSDSRAVAHLVTVDIKEAKNFYEDKLGFTPAADTPPSDEVAIYDCDHGTRFIIYQKDAVPQGDNTVLGFFVKSGLEEVVSELQEKGVSFEEYDTPHIKTVNGIAQMGETIKAAWFKDPDANIIGITQIG